MPPLRVALSLAGIIIVIVGAYYATYYVGTKSSGQNKPRIRNRNINMLDRFAISKDKSFYIMEIAGKVYIVGITNQNMTLLDTLDADEYAEAVEKYDSATWPAASAAQPGGGFFSRFLYYMTEAIKRPRGNGNSKVAGNGSFADSMRSAREAEERDDHGDRG